MAALIIEGQQHQFGAVWGRRSRYTVQKHVQKHIKAACTEAYQRSRYTVQKHVQRHIKEATSLKASTVLSRTRKQKNREQNLSPLSSLPP